MPSLSKATSAIKKKTPRAKIEATSARVEDLRSRALEMLLQGHKCPAIGAALGITRERAWQLTNEALELLKAKTLEDAAAWRALLTQEHVEQLAVGKTLRESKDLDAVQAGVATVDKALTQLRGLWVPALPTSVKQELTGASGGPLQVGGPDLSKLDDNQLEQLEALLAAATGPGLAEPYIDNWHVKALADHVQAFVEGSIKNLSAEIGPGFHRSLRSPCRRRQAHARRVSTSH